MDLCSDCRGTGIKPEPMQGEIFDRTLGRFCLCRVGRAKWQNIVNRASSLETQSALSRGEGLAYGAYKGMSASGDETYFVLQSPL